MQEPKRYLITSALPYANGPLHIGHIAGAYLPADIYVRYLRRMGKDVVFICGSDEHGAAITIQAKKEQTTPRAIIDKYHAIIEKAFRDLGISFNIYHRTSSAIHHATSQEFFRHLYDKGIFEERESEQYYDEAFQQFLADRYIMGTCPVCSNPSAYGDQCEKCGTSLSPTDLIHPVSTLSNQPPVKRSTRHWYLPLNKFQGWLDEWIVQGVGRKEEWKKNVLGQCASWLNEGLQPRAITRDLDWGVKVPVEGAGGKVLYVWLDAPIGYISATKQWALDNGKSWEPYWQDDETKLVHFIGKDNIVFHCLIFPCILKSHGDYILPTNVPANEFMNLEGDKMSTSRNWSVQVHTYMEEFPGKEDVLRYVLCANMPETKDSEFTWKDFQARNNNELVAIYGNFANRVMVLTQKYADNQVPQASADLEAEAYVQEYRESVRGLMQHYARSIESYRFRDALMAFMDVIRLGNKLLTDYEPWKLIKADGQRTLAVLRICLESLADIAGMGEPFLPFSSSRLFGYLGISDSGGLQSGHYRLGEGAALGQPFYLFEKIEDPVIQAKLDALDAIRGARAAFMGQQEVAGTHTFAPVKPQIHYDDFSKLDIRTGRVLEAEVVKGADKLLKLTVDLGFEVRTIVSGIALHFTPDQVKGRKVLVLANLAPRKMRGVESNGMILMAETADGRLEFVTPEGNAAVGDTVS